MKRAPPLSSFNRTAFAIVAIRSGNAQTPTDAAYANQFAIIPMDQRDAVASRQYQGDGLSVSTAPRSFTV